MAQQKKYALRADQFKPLVRNRGRCIASDMITVDGLKVGYMCREAPRDAADSGWQFLSGLESQAYADDPDNLDIYDVNTIANYDPEVIPFLDAPAGCEFERDDESGLFEQVEGEEWAPGTKQAAPATNWPPPGFPLVGGRYAVTRNWALDLPGQFARRVEGRNMVLWRPGLTVRLSAWKNDHGESRAARLAGIKAAAAERFAERLSDAGGVVRFSYRLRDANEDGPVEALYAFLIGDNGHLQMSVQFDHAADEATARRLVDNVTIRT